LDITNNRIAHLKDLLHPDLQCPFQVVQSECYAIRQSLFQELRKQKFAFIPPENAGFFEQEKLFGNAVFEKFPPARVEIKNAGNCLAADLHTAAVFHLMRVAEIGMRALAVHLKVVVHQNKKRVKIEQANWQAIIEAIKDKTQKMRDALSAKNKKTAHLNFYEVLADELYVFKEIWRNNTMHTRNEYNRDEAMGVYGRVRDFMQRLSTKVNSN
jgi:hypothetical protein